MEKARKIKLYGKKHFQQFRTKIGGYKIVYIRASFGWESLEFVNEYLENFCEEEYMLVRGDFIRDGIAHITQCNTVKTFLLVITEFERLMISKQLEAGIRAMENLPKNIRVLLLSSLPLPPGLIPLELEGKLARVGEQEIKPRPEDIRNYFRKQGIALSSRELERIHIDFDDMPLCIYFLGDCMKGSRYGYNRFVKKKCWEEVYAYIDKVIFQPLMLETQNILIQLSYFKRFNGKLLSFVFSLDEEESNDMLVKLYHYGNILKECGEGIYCFCPLMDGFLQGHIEKYVGISEREEICKRVSGYYMNEGDYKEALNFLVILKEEEKLAGYLSEIVGEPDTVRCKELEKYFGLLSERIILKYPALVAGKAILGCCMGDKASALAWYRALANMGEMDHGAGRIGYLDFLMPTQEGFDMMMALRGSSGRKYIGKSDHNLSLIHGGLDFSLNAEEYADVVAAAEKDNWLSGKASGMPEILKGEIWYEKDDLDKAASYINQGIKTAIGIGDMDLVFVGRSILCKIMLYSAQNASMYRVLDRLEEMLEEPEASSLYVNFQALAAGCYMAEDNLDLVKLWMGRWAPDENQEFCILLRYQYLMKIRMHLSMGQYINAQQLLDTLKAYVEDFRRPYLELQTYLLEGILYYRKGNKEWRKCLDHALELGEGMGFVRVFADEGMAVYPLLTEKKIEPRWKGSHYFAEVLEAAKRTMALYPFYLEKKKEAKPFTRAESEIFKLLMNGKKNKDIANSLTISENTVKFHLKNIYVKMGVANRNQAIRMAVYYDKGKKYLFE